MWHLHLLDGTVTLFSSLTELAKSISTQSKQKFRLAPSEYGKYLIMTRDNVNTSLHIYIYVSLPFCILDKSPLLLLCLPPHQLTVKQSINEHSEYEMRKRRAQLLHPVKDFRKYISKCA